MKPMQQVTVSLSLETLRAYEACKEGLAWFHEWPKCYPGDDEISVIWSPLSMVWALSNPDENQRGFARWLIDVGLLPMWSLRGADLTGANLTDADLTDADLTDANLTRAYRPAGLVPAGWDRNENGFLRRA